MFDQYINTRSIVFNLIVVNVLVFIPTEIAPEKMTELFALFYPGSPYFKPMQIITHMFMHGGFMHIFFNMYGLFLFGSILERVWGPRRFLFFYFFTGLGAAFLYTAVQAFKVHNFTGSFLPSIQQVNEFTEVAQVYSIPILGASGAVFGILVAFGMLFPNTELMILFFPVPIKAKFLVTGYFLWEVYQGFAMNPGDNVAHFAHVGGALFGIILVRIWNRNRDYMY
jgi:rhomboid-like protein